MIMYLIGVIATAVVMILSHYRQNNDIYLSDLGFIVCVSLLSWAGIVAVVGTGIVIYITNFFENHKGKPIIKWKSQKKDT